MLPNKYNNTTKVFGKSYMQVNGDIVQDIMYKGHTDGNKLFLNTYKDGTNNQYIIDNDSNSDLLSDILHVKSDNKSLFNRLKQTAKSKSHKLRKSRCSRCSRCGKIGGKKNKNKRKQTKKNTKP